MLKKAFIKAIACLLVPVLIGDPGYAAVRTPQVSASPIAIPARLGVVLQSWIPPGVPAGASSHILLIQDLHGNPGVQRHIAEILKRLARRLDRKNAPGENRFLTVFLEGAHGPFDV